MKELSKAIRSVTSIAAFLIMSGAVAPPLRAEGSHNEWVNQSAYGANRVVESDPGFIGVAGHFTVPVFFIPALYISNDPAKPYVNPRHLAGSPPIYTQSVLQSYLNTHPSPHPYSYASNPNNDKPTFYLGSGVAGQVEVDAGIQWEWLPLNGQPPGWAADLSVSGTTHRWLNPHVSTPGTSGVGPFRAGPGTDHPGVTAFDLEHTVATAGSEQGVVYLKVGMPNTSYHSFIFSVGGARVNPPQPAAPVYTAAQITGHSINMKRIIGMTQQGPARLDGSSMTGCIFSQGQLATYSAGSISWKPNWPIGDVNDATTGYIPGAPPYVNGQPNPHWPVWDQDLASHRHYKIDFPSLTSAANAAGVTGAATIREQWHNAYNSSNPTLAARYTSEAVNIHLETGTKVAGITITRSSARPRR